MKRAAPNVLSSSMELGGNAPFLVFEDADLEAAVDGAMVAKMRNGGEACTAANRFYVQESIAAPFSSRLAEGMSALVVGPGSEPDVHLDPMINGKARDDIAALVSSAVDEGASVLTGGTVPEGAGFFYPPTVLAHVPAEAKILDTEIFGPVAHIGTFSTEHEAVD